MSGEQTFKRKEIKYLLSREKYQLLLPEIEKYARVDAYGKSRINNIYFDTLNYRLIRTSLDKPIYKEKLRLRTYGDTTCTTPAYIEIKKKYRGIVYKRRVGMDYERAMEYLLHQRELSEGERSQVTGEIDEFMSYYEGLKPAMIIGYDRVAMAGTIDPDFRVTFDTNITWRTSDLNLTSGSDGDQIIGEDQYLMEIKVRDAYPLELSRRMSELEIFPVSFSKYGKAYIDMLQASAETSQELATDRETIGVTGKGEMAYA